MKKNLGKLDGNVRIGLAIFLGILFFNNSIYGTWGIVAIIAAVILLITSFTGFCPIYSVFGWHSNEKNNARLPKKSINHQ